MSEINNLSDIKENFDTIKSLLNSIRAQDVLNAGDMSKLLATMNGKLDRINQEENLELMHSILATMKQSLDERHSVLVSKFSTIESLFSNILKNSVDSLKSSEIKELFDIIATNLSVFSREVVSQKDTLTDIAERIEKLRSDDTSSITIITNLEALKRDLERFNNGFESIIVNLNDNFNSIVRTLVEIKEKCEDSHYDKDFENLYMTSNSLLSAMQALDSKSMKIEESLASVLAKCDNNQVENKISELINQNKEIVSTIGELAVNTNIEPLYQKMDYATAIIVGLKDILQSVDNEANSDFIAKLTKIENSINKALDENGFDRIRMDLENALTQIANTVNLSQNDLYSLKNELETVATNLKALDIHVNFQNIQSSLTKSEVNIKTYISDLSNKFNQLSELTFQRTVEDIKQKVDFLGSEIKTVAGQNLEALAGSLIGLKSSITEIESVHGSANEQLFKNVSERLAALENTLAGLLNAQSISLGTTGKQVTELSSTIELKLETASSEFGFLRNALDALKISLEPLVHTDINSVMTAVKAEIIESQNLLVSGLRQAGSDTELKLSEEFSAKFDALKTKTEEYAQNLTSIHKDGLIELRSLLNGVTSTLIDIVSYVSVNDSKNLNQDFEKRIADVEYSIKDCSLDVIEKVSLYIQENIEKINSQLINYDATSQTHFQNLATRIENNSSYIREDIKKAFEAIEAVKAEIVEFKDYVIEDLNNNSVKAEFVDRIAGLRNYITDKLSSFELAFSQDSSNRFSELQDLNSRIIQKIDSIADVNRSVLSDVKAELINSVNDSISASVDEMIDNVRSFVEVTTNSKGQELEKFRTECGNILANMKQELSGLTNMVDLGEKLETSKTRVCEFVSSEFEKAYNSIGELIKNIPTQEDNTPEIERIVTDLLSTQEGRIQADITDCFADFESKIIGLENSVVSNNISIVNKLSEVEAGISRNLERNELAQSEISERLEVFANTLYKLVGNGGITVSQAFEKLDELSALIIEKSNGKLPQIDTIIEKIENLGQNISTLLANEATLKTAETLATLLEKTETTSSDIFTQLQQLSKDTVHYAVTINDSLSFINMELQKPDKNLEILDEIQSIRSFLDVQVECIDNVHQLCKTISDKDKQDEIVALISDFKTDIIAQIIAIFNQISFSTEQEEIINFIKSQQDELRNSTTRLATAIDEVSIGNNKVLENLNNNKAELSHSINGLKEGFLNIAGAENNGRYSLLSVEADIEKLKLSLAQIKDSTIISDKINGVEASLLSLSNLINEVRSDLPLDTIEYLRAQVDRLIDAIRLNDYIVTSVDEIKTKLDDIEFSQDVLKNELNNAVTIGLADVKLTLKSFENAQEVFKDGINNTIVSQLGALKSEFTDIKTSNENLRNDLNGTLVTGLEDAKQELHNFKLHQDDVREALNSTLTAGLAEVKDELHDFKITQEDLKDGVNATLADGLTDVKEELQELKTAQINIQGNVQNDINIGVLELKKGLSGLLNAEMETRAGVSSVITSGISNIKEELEDFKTAQDILKNEIKDSISSNIADVAVDLQEFKTSQETLRKDFEVSFGQVVSTLEKINDAAELKAYISTGFDGLYNHIAQRIDLSAMNSELNAMLTTVISKQDANLSELSTRIDTINNDDVIKALEKIKTDIITQLLTVFNQISFEAESLEIRSEISTTKEFLDAEIKAVAEDVAKIISVQKEMAEDYSTAMERVEEIIENNHTFQLKAISEVAVSNQNLTESLANNHQQELKAIENISIENKELAEALDVLKSQIKAIHTSSDTETNYSLTDIESDLAKLRLSLADMNSNLNKREFNNVLNSLDTVITQIQDLKEFIPAEKIETIDENTVEVLDILEGLALDLKNIHSTQNDIISEVRSDVDVAKSDIQMSLDDFASEIKEYSKDVFSTKLCAVKNDIITQILAIVNQISFVEEQEEIISHIDNVQAQLNKISSGSADEMGDYSLFDVETDITKLRITLEEIKSQGRGAEIDSLVEALGKASETLEFLKTEIPNHEISEIRAELEKIANDIISISIRTNKLLISSDESYKNLKEHIETFQTVIDGVNERTKNLYEEVGMDKIESQVTSIRDIVGRQELTNQVFNEVFEYLAEWIDSTGEKIGYITDKLNNSEDINEIKLSLEELRSATSIKFELDAQSDKIEAMESKLNVIIESLEPTFQNQQDKMQSLERKVNRIVDFFEPAFTKQQERINKLESMLDKILDVVSSDNGYDNALDRLDRISEIIVSKDDSQLVKKLTSFEKQITKLNKSVEKLANVNEK